MRNMRTALAILTVAGGLGFGFAPVFAAPMPSPAAVASPVTDAAAGLVEQAAYYRNRGWRSDRGWRRGHNLHINRYWRHPNRYYSRPGTRNRTVIRLGNLVSSGGSPRSS